MSSTAHWESVTMSPCHRSLSVGINRLARTHGTHWLLISLSKNAQLCLTPIPSIVETNRHVASADDQSSHYTCSVPGTFVLCISLMLQTTYICARNFPARLPARMRWPPVLVAGCSKANFANQRRLPHCMKTERNCDRRKDPQIFREQEPTL